jgi:hypothetical protein
MRSVKLSIVIVFCLLFSLSARSQQVPNADFDSICICAIDRVWQWVCSDVYNFHQDTAQEFTPNTLYTNSNAELHFAMGTVQLNYDAMDSTGNFSSVKLFTRANLIFPDGSPFRAFIFNGEHFYTDAGGHIALNRCGTPFAFRPDSVSGWYKFEDTLSSINESGQVQVLLKKFNAISGSIDTIGFAESNTELSPASQWARFSIPIHYINSAIPDSVVVAFFSSSGSGNPTTLWLDKVQFIYSSLGENEIAGNPGIHIFPNPAHDLIGFNSAMDKQGRFSIYDILGKPVLSGVTSNQIDIHSLPQGCYLLRILDHEQKGLSFTFIKQ